MEVKKKSLTKEKDRRFLKKDKENSSHFKLHSTIWMGVPISAFQLSDFQSLDWRLITY